MLTANLSEMVYPAIIVPQRIANIIGLRAAGSVNLKESPVIVTMPKPMENTGATSSRYKSYTFRRDTDRTCHRFGNEQLCRNFAKV